MWENSMYLRISHVIYELRYCGHQAVLTDAYYALYRHLHRSVDRKGGSLSIGKLHLRGCGCELSARSLPREPRCRDLA